VGVCPTQRKRVPGRRSRIGGDAEVHGVVLLLLETREHPDETLIIPEPEARPGKRPVSRPEALGCPRHCGRRRHGPEGTRDGCSRSAFPAYEFAIRRSTRGRVTRKTRSLIGIDG